MPTVFDLRLLPALLLTLGCASRVVPDPRDATQRYAEAVERKDAEALYALLNTESQRALGKEDVQTLLQQSQKELHARAQQFAQPDAQIHAEAKVRLPDGEIVTLTLEHGHFRVSSAQALPSGALSPAQALTELRAALARQSYPSLLHVMSQDSRDTLEQRRQSLVQALERPETLDVVIDDDRATVTAPGGHTIQLKYEDGTWKIHDFD